MRVRVADTSRMRGFTVFHDSGGWDRLTSRLLPSARRLRSLPGMSVGTRTEAGTQAQHPAHVTLEDTWSV